MKPPVRIEYSTVKKGRRYFQPTAELRELGFRPLALGPEGPEARAEAARLYNEYLKAKARSTMVTAYPPGSLGAFFERHTGKHTRKPSAWWKRKGVRTRDDYHRAWAYIDPRFGSRVITSITTDECETFFDELDIGLSPSERYRTVKVLKSLLKDAHVRLKIPHVSPAAALVNPQAPGRTQIWLASEIYQLVAGAYELGYIGVYLAIRIAWDTLLSPVDCHQLQLGMIKRDFRGWYVERERTKTDKEAFAALHDDTAKAIFDYLGDLAKDMPAATKVVRTRSGGPYLYNKFPRDFKVVRDHVFPGDTRQFLDIRRSGSVEADASGVDRKTIGELLANGLEDNAFLQETYTPPTVSKSREVSEQRQLGRARLQDELRRLTPSNRA